jgi:hypothetical protein
MISCTAATAAALFVYPGQRRRSEEDLGAAAARERERKRERERERERERKKKRESAWSRGVTFDKRRLAAHHSAPGGEKV